MGDLGSIAGSGRSPREGVATHPRTLACRIPWTEEPGGLESTGSQESDKTERLTHTHILFIPSSTEKEEILASNIARHLSTLKHAVVGQG